MTNTNNPFGFRQLGHRDGMAPTMGLERYFIYSSDTNLYFTGDPVSLSSATYGYLQPFGGSTLTPRVAGIFNGCEYYSPQVGRVVWSAFFPGNLGNSSNPVTAYVQSDPEMMYTVQATSAGIGSSMVGGNLNITTALASLGNQTTGVSAVTIASAGGLTAGSSYPFTLVDVWSNYAPPGINGTDNSSAYNIVVVAPNNWFRRAGVTGVTT